MFEDKELLEKRFSTLESAIFDFDGTLVNLENVNYGGMQHVLSENYGKDVDRQLYSRVAAGAVAHKAIENLLNEFDITGHNLYDLREQFRVFKRRGLNEDLGKYVKLIPGVGEFLKLLKSK